MRTIPSELPAITFSTLSVEEFELLRQRVGIDHREQDPLTGRNVQLGRLELVAADGDAGAERLFGAHAGAKADDGGQEHGRQHPHAAISERDHCAGLLGKWKVQVSENGSHQSGTPVSLST